MVKHKVKYLQKLLSMLQKYLWFKIPFMDTKEVFSVVSRGFSFWTPKKHKRCKQVICTSCH